MARMEQLNPFHFFITLSAAEMNWPEVTTTILYKLGKTISYEKGWEEDECKIKIDNVPLPEHKKKNIRNKSSFYKKHFFLVTRMFDNRIKAFKKLLMASGRVSYYSYRIEFQLRGMPHLHGVFWLNKEEIENCLDENGDYKDKEITELIDKWVSCSLDTGSQKLDKLVKELNVHGHTQSCQKGKMKCRFHFPKYPSPCTIIAQPMKETGKRRTKKLEKHSKTLGAVKEIIEDEKMIEDIMKQYPNKGNEDDYQDQRLKRIEMLLEMAKVSKSKQAGGGKEKGRGGGGRDSRQSDGGGDRPSVFSRLGTKTSQGGAGGRPPTPSGGWGRGQGPSPSGNINLYTMSIHL